MGNTLIWKCKTCNFANLSESDACSQCMTSRPLPPLNTMMPPPLPPPPPPLPSSTIMDSSMMTMSTSSTNNIMSKKMDTSQKSSTSSLTRLRLNHPKASQSTSNLKHAQHGYHQNQNQHQRHSVALTHFIDNDFPPIKQSLYMNGNSVKRSNLIHSNGFKQIKKWLRPHEVTVVTHDETHMPVTLFADPSPKDVIQGELGTCWFLSALALLAEKPFLLLNCIISQKYNPFGVHQVCFYLLFK